MEQTQMTIAWPGSPAYLRNQELAAQLEQARALRIELAALQFANELAHRRACGQYKVPLGAMNTFRRELGLEELT